MQRSLGEERGGDEEEEEESAFFKWSLFVLVSSPLLSVLLKAWLTEIFDYAQKDVVIMLLGNKVSKASFLFFFCVCVFSR